MAMTFSPSTLPIEPGCRLPGGASVEPSCVRSLRVIVEHLAARGTDFRPIVEQATLDLKDVRWGVILDKFSAILDHIGGARLAFFVGPQPKRIGWRRWRRLRLRRCRGEQKSHHTERPKHQSLFGYSRHATGDCLTFFPHGSVPGKAADDTTHDVRRVVKACRARTEPPRPQLALARRRLGEISLAAGRLAQLVERLLYTQNVGGSNPSPPTNDSTAYPVSS